MTEIITNFDEFNKSMKFSKTLTLLRALIIFLPMLKICKIIFCGSEELFYFKSFMNYINIYFIEHSEIKVWNATNATANTIKLEMTN